LQAVVDLLESRVVPVTTDPAGLRALWISIGLLDNLVVRVDDKEAIEEHERGLLKALLTEAPAGGASTLAELRRALAERLRTVPWLPERSQQSGPDRAWLKQCREVLTAVNNAQVSLLRSTRYGLANGMDRSPLS
jgi:hypothetical protein